MKRLLGVAAIAISLVCVLEWITWPDVARLVSEPPATTAFIDRATRELRETGKSGRVEWQWVPDGRISISLKRAAVASEDIGFFSHHGFEFYEMREALRKAVRNRAVPRGASTITQQLVKNLWLSSSRDPVRKVKEALLTRQMEATLTKRRILELYLNVVQFGPYVFGAEAAARHYFGKNAADLSDHESALLAAGLPRPKLWNPANTTGGYLRQTTRIEDRMARATFLWLRLGSAPPVVIDTSLVEFLRGDTLPWTDSIPGNAPEELEGLRRP